jgi:CyaY protein
MTVRPSTPSSRPHFPRAIGTMPGQESGVETLSEKAFEARALPELAALVEAFDGLSDELFAELAGDVLTIEFSDDARYVINSHVAARQIWLAAERSAWHFDVHPDGRWLDRRTGSELWAKVGELLTKKLGRPVVFARPQSQRRTPS